VLPERAVALAFAQGGEVGQGRLGRDQGKELGGGDDLVDGEPATEAATMAGGTADGAKEAGPRQIVLAGKFRGRGMGFLAIGTEPADEPLGGQQAEGRGEKKGFDSEVA